VSLNSFISCEIAARGQPRPSTGGARRTVLYPRHRCLACQRRLGTDTAANEAGLTVYEPSAVLTIRFRVCQPCARALDPRADAVRLVSRLATWYIRALRPLPRHP
jgi:hypothetical protein